MIEIAKTFGFDAAHFLPHYPDGHPNRRLHGHSFRCEVRLAGEPGAHGLIRDFEEIEAAIATVRDRLDHRLLNEEVIPAPTLENLVRWIFAALKPALPELAAVTVFRDSYGQSCTYRP